MKAKLFVAALGLSAAVVAPLAFSQALQAVRYQEYPGSINHLANWAMVEKGFCVKQKIKCEPVYLASGPLAQQAAAAGSVDLIFSSLDVMMQAVAKGNDLQVVGTQLPNNIYVLAMGAHVPRSNRAAAYPANMQDLKGKKIGVTARGSGTEMYVKSLLSGAGLAPDSVAYIAVGAPNTAFAALSAKQVDAVLSWDPVPALCESSGQCHLAVDMRRGEGPADVTAMNGGFVGWQARREYVEKNEVAVDAFLRALDEAVVWVKDPKNAAEVHALAKQKLKLGDMPNQEQVMDALIKESIASLGTKMDRKVLHGFNNFLIKNKVIDKPLDVEKLVYKKAP